MRSLVAAAAAAAAAVVALAACNREIKYEPVELPGFSLDLPKSPDMSGINHVGARTQYAAGSLKRGQPRKPIHVVQVSWQPGVLSTDEELVDLIAVLASAMSTQPVKPQVTGSPRRGTLGGQPSVSLDFRVDELRLELIETTCGARAIQIAIAAEDPRPIVERVAGSFVCRPDPAREAEITADRAPVGFDGLTGWTRVDTDNAGFGLTDGTTMVIFVPMADTQAVDKLGFAKVLGSMIEVSLGTWTPADTQRATRHGTVRDIAFGTAVSDGEQLDLAATIWTCPFGPAIFGFTIDLGAADPAAKREAAIDILSRARCLRPGEAPPSFAAADDDAADEADADAPADEADADAPAPPAPVAPAP